MTAVREEVCMERCFFLSNNNGNWGKMIHTMYYGISIPQLRTSSTPPSIWLNSERPSGAAKKQREKGFGAAQRTAISVRNPRATGVG
jgi:hypothetical protein